MKTISLSEFALPSFTTFDRDWFLLSSGDFASSRWNCMTISWGFLGTMWGKPVAQIVVRPQRYTREFLDTYGSFTLSQFPASFRPSLTLLGQKSGRESNKVHESGLTPIASSIVPSPTFLEASLSLECRILFRQEMARDAFLDPTILSSCYPTDDRHILYIGEVVAALKADQDNV